MNSDAPHRSPERWLLQARLANQWLEPPAGRAPSDVVSRLCAVQAQDERWTPWTVGLRATGCSHAQVLAALKDGSLVRTWLLRGTLHLVAASDLTWLRPLIAPRVLSGNVRRYRQLGLDERSLERGATCLEDALQGGPLPRSTLARTLQDQGLEPTGQRLPYLLEYAALQGRLVCWPAQGREQMYAPSPATDTRAYAANDPLESLTTLAHRYLAGHGPATVEDFAWWSGFPIRDARRAMDGVPNAHEIRAGGRHLLRLESERLTDAAPRAHLLPPFDAYLLGYRDRTPMLRIEDRPRFHRGGGMPRRALLVGGTVAGVWTSAGSGRERRLEITPFVALDAGTQGLVERAASDLIEFYGDVTRSETMDPRATSGTAARAKRPPPNSTSG